jgi:L-alanine-DL-glutamate epimerase-like enolase superfamily enzyme
MGMEKSLESNVNTCSRPSELKITDMRFADIENAPMHCILLKIYTNQGVTGFGEARDFSDKRWALILKNQLIGENPCDIDRIFRKIKQFGGHGRQGGGVSGIETALWDIAGKAYGVPVYQMLGGKFRDRIRMYCDTDMNGKHTGTQMGQALKKRLDLGFTLIKMDLGIELLFDIPGALCAPIGAIDALRHTNFNETLYRKGTPEERAAREKRNEIFKVMHPFTGIQITEVGLDWLEQYVHEVRDKIGWEVPLALDHLGHIGINECVKLGKRLEKYNIAWLEDAIPWQYTKQYAELQRAINIPVCTGEDIYLKENFSPLLEAGGLSVIHPDVLTAGGILETKKIGDLALDHGVAMAIHMAETPVGCMAAVHAAAASENFFALEFHSNDISWWNDIVKGLPKPLVSDGYIAVQDKPGLGIDDLRDEVIAEHLHCDIPGVWQPTEAWDDGFSYDKIWS